MQEDLDTDAISKRVAENVYGAVVNEKNGRLVIDLEAMNSRREQIREEREKRAMPVRDWIEKERRDRVLPKRVIEPITKMFRSSMDLSPSWAKEYREFWNLGDDFSY